LKLWPKGRSSFKNRGKNAKAKQRAKARNGSCRLVLVSYEMWARTLTPKGKGATGVNRKKLGKALSCTAEKGTLTTNHSEKKRERPSHRLACETCLRKEREGKVTEPPDQRTPGTQTFQTARSLTWGWGGKKGQSVPSYRSLAGGNRNV